MKHLISLSFKYIRRQKLRTLLTFLCITLSVFIMCSVAAYSSSLFTTLKNQEIKEDGSWEADISGLFGETIAGVPSEKGITDIPKALDIIKNHTAVDDMFFNEYLYLSMNRGESEHGLGYFELNFGDNEVFHINDINIKSSAGNDRMLPPDYDPTLRNDFGEDEKNSGYFPGWLKRNYGYEVGDEITITITPVYGEFNDSIPEVKAMIDEIRKNNASEDESLLYNKHRPLILSDYFSEDEQNALMENADYGFTSTSLKGEYCMSHHFSEIVPDKEQRGEPFKFTMKIAGFFDDGDSDYNTYMRIYCSAFNDCDFYSFYSRIAAMEYYDSYRSNKALLRISDKIDFDDGLKMLISDLGFDTGKNFYSYNINYNNSLLMFELKGADVITNLIAYIVMGIILLFITWMLVRFIIDNAFEVSVMERSTQFAALRVMGASKGQITALIFTEAFLYGVTAVPLGVCTAFLMCKLVFESLKKSGLYVAEFSVMPFFVAIGIGLSIIAIFISAFTSAMWASRRLSPAEALNFGKPKSTRRKHFKRKTRLDRKSKGLIFSYTMKNIFSQKGRFVMVTITSAVGIMLTTACMLTAVHMYKGMNKELEGEYYDFCIHSYNISDISAFEDAFGDNEHFSESWVKVSEYINVDDEDSKEIMRSFNCRQIEGSFRVEAINRKDYEQYAENIMGMTYDEFLQSGGAIVGFSPYFDDEGHCQSDKETGELIRVRDDFYKPASEYGFNEAPVVTFDNSNSSKKNTLKIIGELCSELSSVPNSVFIPMESAPEFFEGDPIQLSLYLVVNGSENAGAAYEDMQDYKNANDIDYIDNYIQGTGLRYLFKAIVIIIATFILSIWLAGIFSTVSITNTSVLNRSRELMMIRAVGMTRKQLIGTIILESVAFSVFSTVIGIFSGIALSCWALMNIDYIPFIDALLTYGGAKFAALVILLVINFAVAIIAALPCISSLKKRMK